MSLWELIPVVTSRSLTSRAKDNVREVRRATPLQLKNPRFCRQATIALTSRGPDKCSFPGLKALTRIPAISAPPRRPTTQWNLFTTQCSPLPEPTRVRVVLILRNSFPYGVDLRHIFEGASRFISAWPINRLRFPIAFVASSASYTSENCSPLADFSADTT